MKFREFKAMVNSIGDIDGDAEVTVLGAYASEGEVNDVFYGGAESKVVIVSDIMSDRRRYDFG